MTDRVLVAGVFAGSTKNSAHGQLLLRDRLPGNAVEERLVGEPLPCAGDIVRLEVGQGEMVRASLRDGNDQDYILDSGHVRIAWYAFCHPVDNDWFPDVVIPGAPYLKPCFIGLM